MRAGLAVAAAACAVVAVGAAIATAAPRAPLQRVTVFGDSQITAVASTPNAREMLAKGIDLDLRTAVCRRLVKDSCPYEGARPTTVLDEIRDSPTPLGHVVVLLVGYNDFEAVWPDDVATVVRALVARDVTRVLWLTLTERRDDWVRMNANLRAAAKDWPQLEVLDWSDAADPAWFRGDDIHLTYDGAYGLASYLHVALFSRGIAAPSTGPAPAQVALRITIRGAGAVTSKGVRCRVSCSQLLPVGTLVRLTAHAPAGSVFDRWAGACTGKRASCSLKLTRGTTVVARFDATRR